jgi:hypothetical protein
MEQQQRRGEFDLVLDALSNSYRRQLLVALLEHNPQDERDTDPLDLLPEVEQEDTLEVELVHSHLPKLEEMGYISWDRPTDEISKGPRWDTIAPLLKLMQDHEEDLPDGWL